MTRQALPYQTSPRLDCRAPPVRAPTRLDLPYHALTALLCRATPLQAVPYRS